MTVFLVYFLVTTLVVAAFILLGAGYGWFLGWMFDVSDGAAWGLIVGLLPIAIIAGLIIGGLAVVST